MFFKSTCISKEQPSHSGLQAKSKNPLPWSEKLEIEPTYEPNHDEIIAFLLTLPRNPAYR